MTSRTTERFRKALQGLPRSVRNQARSAYRRFQENPHHPSLRLKQVHPVQPVFAVRVSREYRALGVRTDDVMIWFWIGSHSEYDLILKRL